MLQCFDVNELEDQPYHIKLNNGTKIWYVLDHSSNLIEYYLVLYYFVLIKYSMFACTLNVMVEQQKFLTYNFE